MKLQSLAFFIALASLASLAFAEPSAEKTGPDPIIGRWQWSNSGQDFYIRSGGTLGQSRRSGTWECVNPKSQPRKYVLNWDNGKFFDTLYLGKGGTELTGQNQFKNKLSAKRLPVP